MIVKAMIFAAAALTLAACGNPDEAADNQLQSHVGAAIDERALAEAVASTIDEQAIEGLARGAIEGAAREAVREVLPVGEMAAIGAVVDEQALAAGIGQAIDGQAPASGIEGATGREPPAQ